MKIVVTGSDGFVGKNLMARLNQLPDLQIEGITIDTPDSGLNAILRDCSVLFHLAGVNRPQNVAEFKEINMDFTQEVVNRLKSLNTFPKIIFTSSAQAVSDNPYGQSKLEGENVLKNFAQTTNAEVIIYRLPGVFGKWCRPNYNSVVATFCYNVANNLPVVVNAPEKVIDLVYIDDVCEAFISNIDSKKLSGKSRFKQVKPVHSISLQNLSELIKSFPLMRDNLLAPRVGNALEKKLYSTYLTYLPENNFNYPLTLRTDNRGSLFELIKSNDFGQIFLSTTKPGITRGNHYHHTKTEKFCVIKGEGLIRFRKIDTDLVLEYKVNGDQPSVVDIPPGYSHSIKNIGNEEMITLFWANEIFDPNRMDTYFVNV